MTPNRFFIPGLDGLRFMSFLLIFIHHTERTNVFLWDSIAEIGWIGVDIFFCLSAFLLTRLLKAEIDQTNVIQYRKFFMRRILRIWPLFFTYLIIVILFSVYKNDLTSENSFRIVSLLTFSDNFFTAAYGYNPIGFTEHLWTIAYEEQFYLLIPFTILFLNTRTPGKRILFFTTVAISGFIVRFLFIFYKVKHPAIWVLPITHFESILTGIALGLLDLRAMNPKRIHILFLTILSGCLILFLPGTGVISNQLMILYPCVGLFTGGILYFSISTEKSFIQKLLASSLLSYLGKISFGLYVFHSICIVTTEYVFRKFLHINSPIVTTAAALLFTIGVAALSYTILERPFLQLKKKFTVIPSR